MLPGPAPKEGDTFPPNKTYYEIPIAIQDRAFNERRFAVLPDCREFFDGATAEDPGFIPTTDLSPIWNPEFFGNMIMVNGNTWPFQTVEQRRYRLRFLNGCQSRFLPGLQPHPRSGGLGHRERGRLPGCAGEPHRRPTATGSSWAWPSEPT